PQTSTLSLHDALPISVRDEGGEIRVASSHTRNEICVTVRDNGHGMSQDVLARAFDPFFTTHDVGKGTGLGLTVSRDIVRAHGGRDRKSTRLNSSHVAI